MRQLTDVLEANHSFVSGYGTVTNREWCNLEVARIMSDGTRKACIKDINDKICLMVDAVPLAQEDYHSPHSKDSARLICGE